MRTHSPENPPLTIRAAAFVLAAALVVVSFLPVLATGVRIFA